MFDQTKARGPARLCQWGSIALVLLASASMTIDREIGDRGIGYRGIDRFNGFGPPIPLMPEMADWEPECLSPPVSGELIDTFLAPECPYCTGRRTVRFAAAAQEEVLAPTTGRVTFAGSVAGIGYVTIQPTSAPFHLVTVGGLIIGPPDQAVARGETIGVVGTVNGIHLSVRQVDPSGPVTYLDPEPLLARWRVRARLIPLDGSDPRPSQSRYGCSAVLRAVP